MERRVKLKIANRCFAVESHDLDFLKGMERIFYLADPSGPEDFSFKVGFSGSAPFDVKSFKEGQDGWHSFSPKRFIDGYYRLGDRLAEVILEEKDRAFFPWLLTPLLVSVFYALERDQGEDSRFEHVLFHGSGVARNHHGYLFTGRSGAGKTEVAKLSAPSARVINDELVLISRDNGDFYITGGHYKGTLPQNDPTVKGRLKGIYILAQDSSVYVRRLGRIEALRKLMDTIFFDDCFYLLSRLRFRGELVGIASLMAENVPVYELHFTKDDRFWRCID